MVGYGNVTKGYRLYDAPQGRIFHSYDVQFNEQVKQESPNTEATSKSDYHLIAEFSETEIGNDVSTNQGIKSSRSNRTKKLPNYYGQESSNVCEIPQSPVSYKEATTWADKRKQQSHMETEMNSLSENNVWDLVKLSPGKRTVRSKWVYIQLEQMDLCRDTKQDWLHKALWNRF